MKNLSIKSLHAYFLVSTLSSQADVCSRTQMVRVAPENALKKNCQQITKADLASISNLEIHTKDQPVPPEGIWFWSFKPSDFSDLKGLVSLNITDKGQPHFFRLYFNEGDFSEIPQVESIDLDIDVGLNPPGRLFKGLNHLKKLSVIDAFGLYANSFPSIYVKLHLEEIGSLEYLSAPIRDKGSRKTMGHIGINREAAQSYEERRVDGRCDGSVLADGFELSDLLASLDERLCKAVGGQRLTLGKIQQTSCRPSDNRRAIVSGFFETRCEKK
jgi:hypothetical protein